MSKGSVQDKSTIEDLLSIPRVGKILERTLKQENIIINNGVIEYPVISTSNRDSFIDPVEGSFVLESRVNGEITDSVAFVYFSGAWRKYLT